MSEHEHNETHALKVMAATAASLIVDEGFKQILRHMKDAAIRSWANAGKADDREKAWHDLHAVGRLEHAIGQMPQAWELEKTKHATRKPKK